VKTVLLTVIRHGHPTKTKTKTGFIFVFINCKHWPKVGAFVTMTWNISSNHIQSVLFKTGNIWNTHLHNTAAQLDLPNYLQAIETLYEQKHKLSPAAQATLYWQPIQAILDQPAPKMQQWVTHGYQYLMQQLKAEQKQATLHTPDIQTFFQPLAQHTNDLQPPWEYPVSTLQQCGSSLYIVDIKR